MKNNHLKRITIVSLLTAATIVIGRTFLLPTPTGLVSLLDVGIYFTAFYLGSKEGAVVGGLSGFLIDLLAGYPQWMIFSLIAHGLQGFFAGLLGLKRIVGILLATVSMVGCYFLASLILGNGLGAALAAIGENVMQNTVGMIIGYVIFYLHSRVFPKE